jgi:TPP-dependent pyruvate/acetoin dehydrogenase alpha subunit
MESETRDRIKEDVAREVQEAATWAEAQPLPDPATAFDGVYSHEL